MTADEFLAWSASWAEGERYELVDGIPVRLQAERIAHAMVKLSIAIEMRRALRAAERSTCHAFIDGVSVRIAEDTLREPDVLVHCGPFDPNAKIADNPVILVEVVSPSSATTDRERKLIDYFAIPSVRHYLVVLIPDRRVIHYEREIEGGGFQVRIAGMADELSLAPPGIRLSVAEFFADLPQDKGPEGT